MNKAPLHQLLHVLHNALKLSDLRVALFHSCFDCHEAPSHAGLFMTMARVKTPSPIAAILPMRAVDLQFIDDALHELVRGHV